jgi:hypothetical protein
MCDCEMYEVWVEGVDQVLIGSMSRDYGVHILAN